MVLFIQMLRLSLCDGREPTATLWRRLVGDPEDPGGQVRGGAGWSACWSAGSKEYVSGSRPTVFARYHSLA
jgi:hypothetical protein